MNLTQTRIDADPRIGTTMAKTAVTGPWLTVQAVTGSFEKVTASTEMHTSTPVVGDSSTKVATTEFVTNALVNWTGGGEGSATFTAAEKSKLANITEQATRATVSTSTSVGTSLAVITVNGSATTIRNAVQGLVLSNKANGTTNVANANIAYLNLVANNAVQSSLNIVAGNNVTFTVADGVLTVNASNTEYGNAEEGSAGLLSAADKAKLDGIEEQAQKNTVNSVRGSNDTDARVGDVVLDYTTVGAAPKEHGNHVPALLAGTQGLFLRCDNTWCSPTNMDEISEATVSSKGLMTPDHVNTLNQLSSRVSTLETGMDNVNSALTMINGNVSTVDGRVTGVADRVTDLENEVTILRSDLNEIEDELYGDETPYIYSITANANDLTLGKANGTSSTVTLPLATTTTAGMMSAEDKALLNKLAALVSSEGGLIIPSSRKGGNIWVSS